LGVEERLGDGARDIDDQVFATQRVDQADLILDRAAMALRTRAAGREDKREKCEQRLHEPRTRDSRKSSKQIADRISRAEG